MAIKVYSYRGCGTCRKAIAFLEKHGIEYETVPVRESPPSPAEIKAMLTFTGGDIRKLFNTSGGTYREMNLKERLDTLSEKEAIALLAAHGNLVKRPFVLSKTFGLVGFREDTWKDVLGQ